MRALTLEERKKVVTEELRYLMDSCVEGYNGDWDPTGEGREGFAAMYSGLLTIARTLGIVVRGAKRI